MNNRRIDKPIRICFVAPKAYPLFNPAAKGVFGGAEVDLYLLATELAKDKNFAVSFITADYGQEAIETIEAVRIIKSLDFKEYPLAGAIKIWKAMRKANAGIYMLKTASPGTPLVAFFCRWHKKVFVYRTAKQSECDGTYLKEHYFLGKAFKWSLRRAEIILVQNSIDKKNLARTIGVSAKIIPNGHRPAGLEEYERNVVLWIGRSAKIKRPELFIDLAEKMPDEKFIFVCQRATGDKKYEELIAQAKQVKNLEFLERVPFDEISSHFKHAKVFVNTSDAEGFPNTFIQACMSGTPILSLNVNPDGFLDKYNCGICCNNNMELLSDSLEFMLAENKYVELGKNARNYAEQNHDVKKIAEEYKKLFRKLS